MDTGEQAHRRQFEELMERSESLRRRSEALAAAAASIKAEVELLWKDMVLARRALQEQINPDT